ncbi:hypothetical protein PMI14_01387, partial [Acidovorax sp. CF316]|uniref:hypothetical protein n=1 Tax=Acidovorax sp. CF316 TaxID=1144317 RepID=UPI00026BCEF9
DGQDLVDLAFGIAQLERSASAPPQNGIERPNGSAPSAPYLPIQMSRDAGKDGAGAAPEKGPLGSENNPRPVPLTDFKVRITTDNDPSNAITMLVDGEDVDFASVEITDNGPILSISKRAKIKSTEEHVIINTPGVTEAILRKLISYYIETTGSPPIALPGKLAEENLKNFQKEFDKHRKSNHNGTKNYWAQAAIRDISFGKARGKVGYEAFEITLKDPIDADGLKDVPSKVNIIARKK